MTSAEMITLAQERLQEYMRPYLDTPVRMTSDNDIDPRDKEYILSYLKYKGVPVLDCRLIGHELIFDLDTR